MIPRQPAPMKTAQTVLLCVLAWGTAFPMGDPREKEIGRTTEKELKVLLSAGFGSVSIARGDPGKILFLSRQDDGNPGQRPRVSYEIRNRVGYLELNLSDGEEESHGGSIRAGALKGGDWILRFTDALPISFDIELGVGSADLDLSGLRVKDFTLSTGASDVTLAFNEPNPVPIEFMNIESGVSQFRGIKLGNANFHRFKFGGGLGAYTLDFAGSLRHEVDADIGVALGTVTIYIPEDVGARLYYDESWVTRLDYDRAFRKAGRNEYVTEDFSRREGRMNIRVESAIGSVKVRRR
ncbi:MAG: hypothetical protein WB626_05100 [Bacteroidota bacterium]